MKILVTGFKPFLGHQINPSEQLALYLSSKFVEVTSLILPVEFIKAAEILAESIEKHRFDYVLMLGQAAGRAFICFEKVGLNWIETENKDEAGVLPMQGSIVHKQDLALMTKFPVDKYFELLKKEHWPVKVSFSAGTYVCNELYFRTLLNCPDTKSVFIHVPLVPEQKNEDLDLAMPYDMQKEVMTRLIDLLIYNN